MMETIMRKSLMMLVSVITSCLVLNGEVAKAHLPKLKQATKADGSLSFLVVGDWGRKGQFNQTFVAKQMGILGEQLDIDLVISTGDNFYEDGLTGVDDPAFAHSFTNVYTAPSLNKKWFHVLGNHDYRGDVLAQLNTSLRNRDPRFICMRSYILQSEIVDFFFVDTTPFHDKYFDHPKDSTYDWRGVVPRQKYISKLLKDVDRSLKMSNAKWKFVIGHHTIRSAGSHGNTEELVAQLLPILEDNDVDLYINGHDHCLEHISSPDNRPLQFLTSGGGSKAWRGDAKEWNPAEELKLYYDGQGFMSVQVSSTQIDVVFYDVYGKVLHKWSRTKPDPYASS